MGSAAAAALAPIAIAVPIAVACLLAAVGRLLPRRARDVLTVVTAGGVATVDVLLLRATAGGRVVTWVAGWTPARGVSVGIVLVADPIGAGLALLAAVLLGLVTVYSWRYFEDAGAHYQALLLVFLSGMTGFALTGDLFDMFVFFELMGAVAYALTGFLVDEPSAVQGALNFGIINSLGAYLSLMGIGVLYARYSALGLPQLSAAMSGAAAGPDVLVVAAFVLVCTGLLVKAAVVPFHFWTADAEAVAPTPVCVLLSGVMVVLGVYGVARVYWTAFSGALPAEAVRPALVVLGSVTAVVGAGMCVLQRHLKRLLAYSTIAHVGLFLTATGVLDPAGTAGAALYVLGHAGVKGALFLLAGIVLNRYGSVDERRLHGRGRDARWMPWLWLLAALALAGLPPFGTGLGKAVGEEALVAAGLPFGPVLFVAVSALTGGAALRAGARVYRGLGAPPHDAPGPEVADADREQRAGSRVRATMLTPAVVLLAAALAVGAVPAVGRAVAAAAAGLVDRRGYVTAALGGAPGAPPPVPEAWWTTSGVLLGLLSTLLAVGVAAAALWAPSLPRPLTAVGRAGAPLVAGLRRVHSGRIGDYVAWLFLGTAVFAALVAVPLG